MRVGLLFAKNYQVERTLSQMSNPDCYAVKAFIPVPVVPGITVQRNVYQGNCVAQNDVISILGEQIFTSTTHRLRTPT